MLPATASYRYWPASVVAALLCIAGWFAYSNHFIQDDAFIAFRYARHFADGKGLVWYPGSAEFGYTNFAFVLATGLLMKLGLTAESAAFTISVPAYMAAITLTFMTGRRIGMSIAASALACLALATHPTFSAYATGGLETSLQVCLLLAAYYQAIRWYQSSSVSAAAWMGGFSALALLTRLDSALLLLPAYGFLGLALLWRCLQHETTAQKSVRLFFITAAIPTLAVACMLAFCAVYYGQALPNTFYAKVAPHWYFAEGLDYFHSYVDSRRSIPLVLITLALVCWLQHYERASVRRHYHLLFLSMIAVWVAYLFFIGGDFMDFRMLVPIMPFFYLLVVDLVLEYSKAYIRAASLPLLAALILYGSNSQSKYTDWLPYNMQSTRLLNNYVMGQPVNWIEIGQVLHRYFYTGKPTDVKIAVTAAGAIPYYSGLPSIDQHGLTTRAVLTPENYAGDYPGHRFNASMHFLQNQGVNLLIDHPHFYCNDPHKPMCVPGDVGLPPTNTGAPLLMVPLDKSCYLLTYYMHTHPSIETMIHNGKIHYYQEAVRTMPCK